MPSDWQTIVCLGCVAAAAFALIRRSWQVIRGESECGGCAGGCGDQQKEGESEQLVSAEHIALLYEDGDSRLDG